MKYRLLAMILTALSPMATTYAGEQAPEGENARDGDLEDIRTLLRKGRDDGSLPPGVVVRLDAYLWGSKASTKDIEEDVDGHLAETWEFTANHVHCVERVGKTADYRRTKSLPYDSTDFCKALLDGGIYAIATQEGLGEPLQFVGTDFELGHRSIEILIDGQSALEVGESCAGAGYRESNARAFAEIYERLASQARAAFEAKAPVNVE